MYGGLVPNALRPDWQVSGVTGWWLNHSISLMSVDVRAMGTASEELLVYPEADGN